MRKLSTAIALALLCACNGNGAPHDVPADVNVVVKTIDAENKEFKAEKVTWWYLDKRETRYKLDCAEDLCSTWTIGKEASGSIAVTAHASKVKANDEYCWDLFEGEAVIKADPAVPQEITIVLSYSVTACT